MCIYIYIYIHIHTYIRVRSKCCSVAFPANGLRYSPLLKKPCIRQVVLDKWFPLTFAAVFPASGHILFIRWSSRCDGEVALISIWPVIIFSGY